MKPNFCSDFCQDFEVEVQARFWSWSLVSILPLMFCRGYGVHLGLDSEASLGSIVPLAMFSQCTLCLCYFLQIGKLPIAFNQYTQHFQQAFFTKDRDHTIMKCQNCTHCTPKYPFLLLWNTPKMAFWCVSCKICWDDTCFRVLVAYNLPWDDWLN